MVLCRQLLEGAARLHVRLTVRVRARRGCRCVRAQFRHCAAASLLLVRWCLQVQHFHISLRVKESEKS